MALSVLSRPGLSRQQLPTARPAMGREKIIVRSRAATLHGHIIRYPGNRLSAFPLKCLC